MANRTKVLETLNNYFNEKGRVLTSQEYTRETDAPIRIQQIRNIFGSWKNMERLRMASENRVTDGQTTDVDAVLAARNKAAYDAMARWRDASENQDVKARREAEAQLVAETLAKNAATAEGANANKIAIGGKLPQEQQDYTAMGATVEKDPITGEQTIVDTKPEVVSPALDDPRTPEEIKAAVSSLSSKDASIAPSDTASVVSAPVDTSTASGSTGTPSVAEVQALGGDTEESDSDVSKTKVVETKTSSTKK